MRSWYIGDLKSGNSVIEVSFLASSIFSYVFTRTKGQDSSLFSALIVHGIVDLRHLTQNLKHFLLTSDVSVENLRSTSNFCTLNLAIYFSCLLKIFLASRVINFTVVFLAAGI